MLQNPLGAYTVFHWVFMNAKIHNGENELEFKFEELTAEIYSITWGKSMERVSQTT